MAKKVISMLEFLRTGVLGGIACGCTTDDVIRVMGKPDYEAISHYIKEISWFRYDSLEVWFHTEQKIVYRMTLQRFEHRFWNKARRRENILKKRTHLFKQSKPKIPRTRIDSWVIREGMEVFTFSRFLKMAKIEFRHSQWWRMKNCIIDQIDLDSSVRLFFEPSTEDKPGLSYIEVRNDEIQYQLFQENF